MKRKYWTEHEENYIKKNISILSVSDFSNYFKVSKAKIVDKIHKMGLNSKKARGILWTKEEDSLLKEHFEYAPKNYLMSLLPDRSWPAILQRGNKTLLLNRKSQDHISVNYNFFSTWNEYSAYTLGLILADGWITYKQNYQNSISLQIELQKKDYSVLKKIAEKMNYKGKIMILKDSVKLQCNNAKIVEDLIKLGIPLKNKSYTAKMINGIPYKYLRHFIRGLIDGDGWVSFYDNRIAIGFCGTESLTRSVQKILCPTIKIAPPRKDKNNNVWRFEVKGKKAINILYWLYNDSNIYIERKKNTYLNYINSPYLQ